MNVYPACSGAPSRRNVTLGRRSDQPPANFFRKGTLLIGVELRDNEWELTVSC